MTEESPDVVLGVINRMYAWQARRPGLTIIGTYFGRLLLTSRRLMFLSTGSNGIIKAFPFKTLGRLPAHLTFGQTAVEELNIGALVNPGSLNFELQRVAQATLSRRFDFSNYLVIEIPRTDGSSRSISFMTRYGLTRGDLLAFQESLTRARDALLDSSSHTVRASDNVHS